MVRYPVIDTDWHVLESLPGIHGFLDPRWQHRRLFPGNIWGGDVRGKPGHVTCSSRC